MLTKKLRAIAFGTVLISAVAARGQSTWCDESEDDTIDPAVRVWGGLSGGSTADKSAYYSWEAVAEGSHAGTDNAPVHSASCPDPEVRVYMLGEDDDFAAPVDDVYIDSDWLSVLTVAVPEVEVVGFDDPYGSGGELIPFTFLFDLADGEEVTGAWLTFRLKPNGGGPTSSDVILFDQTEPAWFLFDNGWDGTLSVLTIDLSNVRDRDLLEHDLLPLLADGLLNCADYDDHAIDYATLELHVTPPCYDFRYHCAIVEAPSPEDQTTELPPGLSVVPVRETFYVEFWATDSGEMNTGVVSAYTDMDYPEDMVSCDAVGHTDLFHLFTDGTCDASFVDELGGSQLDPGVGVEPEWARVAYVELTADATGQADFALLPATTESSAHGRGVILPEDIDYGTCTVEIVCPCIYDLDDNCNIAGGDLGLFAPCWGCCDDEPCWDEHSCEDKDFDCNGCVSGGDLAWFAVGWNKTCDQIDPMADYPPCRQCDGPVMCPLPGAARGEGAKSTASPGAGAMARESVKLTARLRKDDGQDGTLAELASAAPGPVKAGQVVYADVWVRDDHPNSQGLTVVFADVLYDPAQFHVVSIDPGDTFTLFAEAMVQDTEGVVRHLGGATLEPGQGANGWTRVSVVELQAKVDVKRSRLVLRPSEGEAVSRHGQGLVPTEQIQVIQSGQADLPDSVKNAGARRTLGR